MVRINITDPGVVGGKQTGIWPLLQCRGPSLPDIWVRDVGPDAMDGTDPWVFPPQGGPSADMATDAATI